MANELTENVNPEGLQFKLHYVEFQAIVAYLNNEDVEVNFLFGEAKRLYTWVEDFATKFNTYPTIDYIESLTGYNCPAELIPVDHINELLRKEWLARKIQLVSTNVSTGAVENPERALNDMANFLFEMNCVLNKDAKSVIKFSDIDRRIEEYETLQKPIYNTRCTFGLPMIDGNTEGLCDGDVAIIVGDTNQGKSWLSKKVALNAVMQGKKVVLLVFEEMENEAISRVDSIFGNVPSKQYMGRTLDAQQLMNLKKRVVEWKVSRSGPKGELWVPKTTDIQRGSAVDIVKLYKTYDADLIIIDQLTLLSSSLKWDDMGGLLRDLKEAAVALQKPILVLTQTNMSVVKSIDEVGLEVIAHAKDITRHADTIIYVANDRDCDQIGTKFFKLLKTRRGKKIITRNRWDLDFSMIEEMGEFIPEIKQAKGSSTSSKGQKRDNAPQQKPAMSDYTMAWRTNM